MRLIQFGPPLKKIIPYISWIIWITIAMSFFFQENTIVMGNAALMGDLAVITFWFVVLPGILRRFGAKGWLQQVQILLMSIRRQLGDLMFSLACAHFTWMRLFFYLRVGLPVWHQIAPLEYLGFSALALLAPLFITSNDWSLRTLKKNWQRVHNLIYLAMWGIALHTTLTNLYPYGAITLVIATLQLISLLYVGLKKRSKSSTIAV